MNNELPTGRPKMKADNQMKNDHEIEVSKALGNLPLELRAMNEAMKMVFNAVTNAAQQGPQPIVAGVNPDPVGAAPDFNAEVNLHADTVAERFDARAAEAAPRRMDIETAIMRAPGFDYLLASEIFAALQRRLELRYQNLNPQVEEAMQRLAKSFDHVTG